MKKVLVVLSLLVCLLINTQVNAEGVYNCPTPDGEKCICLDPGTAFGHTGKGYDYYGNYIGGVEDGPKTFYTAWTETNNCWGGKNYSSYCGSDDTDYCYAYDIDDNDNWIYRGSGYNLYGYNVMCEGTRDKVSFGVREVVEGDNPVYDAMLIAMNGEVTDHTAQLVRMLSCLSGVGKNDKSGRCASYASMASYCLNSDKQALTDWRTVMGSNVSVEAGTQNNYCKDFNKAVKKAAANKRETRREAAINFQKIEVLEAHDDNLKEVIEGLNNAQNYNYDREAVLIVVKATLRNFDENSTFKINNVRATNGSVEVVGYSNQKVDDKKGYPKTESEYTPFDIGPNNELIGIFNKEAIKERGESSVWIAFKTYIKENKNAKRCTIDVVINYSFSAPSHTKGHIYDYSIQHIYQHFIVPDETTFINGKGPYETKSADYPIKKIELCTCPLDRGPGGDDEKNKPKNSNDDYDTNKQDIGFGQVCADDVPACTKDPNTGKFVQYPCIDPDSGNIVYQYLEGYLNGKPDYESCLTDVTDVAENPHNRSDISSVRNRYCAISCKEDYTFEMPYKKQTQAGRYFKIDEMKISGKLTCFSSVPNHEKFAQDLVYAQAQMIEKYKDYVASLPNGGTAYDYVVHDIPDKPENRYNKYRDAGLNITNRNLKVDHDSKIVKSDAEKALEEAYTAFDDYIKDWNNCANWPMLEYNYKPIVRYKYDEPQESVDKWVTYADSWGIMDSKPKEPKPTSNQRVYCSDPNPKTDTYECPAQYKTTKPQYDNSKLILVRCTKNGCTENSYEGKIVNTQFTIQDSTVEAKYYTKRAYYVSHNNKKIRVAKTDTERKAEKDEDMVDGLPVDWETKPGVYYYHIKVSNLGMFYTVGETDKLGRILAEDTEARNSTINRTKKKYNVADDIEVDKNEYVCSYQVDAPPPPTGGNYHCEADPSIDLTKCVSECMNGDMNKEKACISSCEVEAECPPVVCPSNPSIDLKPCVKEGNTFEYCEEELCPDKKGSKFCIKEARSFYVCTSQSYDPQKCTLYGTSKAARAKALADVGCPSEGPCEQNISCCPDCIPVCLPPCNTCEGEECKRDAIVSFREITTSSVNPNKRVMSWNWNTFNPVNKFVAEKARVTIDEIEATMENNLKAVNNGAGSNGGNNGAVVTSKAIGGNDYTIKIVMTPDVASKIRDYNKAHISNGSYSNPTMECKDYKITEYKFTEESCESAGYQYKNGSCYLPGGAGCYSTFINLLVSGEFGDPNIDTTTRSQAMNMTSGFKQYPNVTSEYGKIVTNNYSAIIIYPNPDINDDKVADVGPAWR